MRVIELVDVSVRLGGIQILEDITLQVPPGDYVALVGQNGAGKTTLFKVILGLLRPEAGTVRLFDQELDAFQAWERVGYIPQHAVTFDTRFPASVREVVSLGRAPRRGLFRRLAPEDHRAVDGALETVGLRRLERRRIGTLSGGERQRALIARALASDPELLLLDEPAAGVDPGTQETLYAFLHQLNEERGITLLLATHDLGAVMGVAKTVACINKRLVCHRPATEGLTAEELVATYGSPVAAATHTH